MDVKGIAWAGRLYQKFETMCLEVEDIICQDTVKYVENQVEVVGASVKRFYSDVMQDFLPPSELNDEKVMVCNSSLEKYENVVICKKPVRSMKIKGSKTDEEMSNPKVTADVIIRDIVHKLPCGDNRENNLRSVSSPYSANSAQIDGYSRQKDDENLHHKLDVGGRESTRVRKCLTETSPTNLEKKYANDASSCCTISNPKCEASSNLAGNMEATLSDKDTRSDSVVQSSNETKTELVNISSKSILVNISSKSIEDNEKEMKRLSYGDSSAELDGRSGSWSLDEIEQEHDATILEHGTDNNNDQQADEIKLDEACVLVNGDDFHFDSNDEVKRKTYKKKITGAFSFTKKLKRKQEYKELAVKHGYGIGAIPKQEHEHKLSTEDVSESDWQLL